MVADQPGISVAERGDVGDVELGKIVGARLVEEKSRTEKTGDDVSCPLQGGEGVGEGRGTRMEEKAAERFHHAQRTCVMVQRSLCAGKLEMTGVSEGIEAMAMERLQGTKPLFSNGQTEILKE